ncbi:glucose-6-phosphate dehydrogenase [Euzebya tangerina]|uniref:glucose-6-phosphate dehydrogenase n=1 Tax=Euzebya tangerina TaxID=591198 RepID=UPI000E31CD45|nr:glucose-6-phosphate dehydrogenase [Euzebya tangerina]
MSTQVVPDDAVIVVFGGSGDLSRRKLMPAFWDLYLTGLMPERWRLIGTSRTGISDEAFAELARDGIEEFGRGVSPEQEEAFASFAANLTYRGGGFGPGDTETLVAAISGAEEAIGGEPNRLFYLAIPPAVFGPITQGLGEGGLDERARVVFEKPFGVDPASFAELDETVHAVLDESQVYRIDHFLGKEALQNVLALRFANGMFEPVWNRQHIDHIQIDVPESIGIGTRADFYEETGAMRDMIVTHLFQVLSVVALEPPVSLESDDLMDEKSKVFQSMTPLRPSDVVYGQYESYRSEDGVAPDSCTETFVAAKVEIDNWRWAGVPIFMRTGKQMAAKHQTVTLAFKRPPRQMFAAKAGGNGSFVSDGLNHLTLDMSGDPGFSISFLAKKPGPRMDLGPASMRFSYEQSFFSGPAVEEGTRLDAYERLLHDALLGDRTLFTRADGIGRTWDLVAPILEESPDCHPYEDGSWGPQAAMDLIAPRGWHLPEGGGES